MTVSSAEETVFTSQLLRVFIPITLQPRRSGGKLPETELTLSAQLPEPVLEIVDTIVRGARPDARGQSVKRFMTPKDLPEGRVWELKMKESRRGSLTARSFTVDNVEP